MIADLSTGELVPLKDSGEGYWEKNPVAYSPDGKWLACTDLASHICILETTHYEQVKKFAGHTANVYSIAWSRDGRQLVSGSADRTVRLWNFDNGECVQKLEGHTDEVYAVAFHPDGTRIASASRNATIGLWDAATWEAIVALEGAHELCLLTGVQPRWFDPGFRLRRRHGPALGHRTSCETHPGETRRRCVAHSKRISSWPGSLRTGRTRNKSWRRSGLIPL